MNAFVNLEIHWHLFRKPLSKRNGPVHFHNPQSIRFFQLLSDSPLRPLPISVSTRLPCAAQPSKKSFAAGTNWSKATRNKQHSTYACWTSNRFVTGGGREIIGRMMERERGRSKRISTNAFSRVCHTSRGKLSRLGWSQVKSETNGCARKIFREDGGICPRMDGNEMNRILMARMGQDWSASRLTGQWECALTHPILLRPAETHIVRNAILSTRSDRLMKDITDEGAL